MTYSPGVRPLLFSQEHQHPEYIGSFLGKMASCNCFFHAIIICLLFGIGPSSCWPRGTAACLRDGVLRGSKDRIVMDFQFSQAVAGHMELSPFGLGREIVV